LRELCDGLYLQPRHLSGRMAGYVTETTVGDTR
jgi:hypothetical protein